MGKKDKTNLIRQSFKFKQFMGWFIATVFPFAVRGIMDVTEVPLIGALIYWLICGILLRYILEKNMPYFRIQLKPVQKEVILLTVFTVVCVSQYMQGIPQIKPQPLRELLLNVIFFVLLNGIFEQLVWINIYELAGCKIKLAGLVAAFINICLTYSLFWNRFIPVPQVNLVLLLLSQTIMFLIPVSIYNKTGDLTIWCIHRVVYNLIIVYITGFGISMFIHI